MMTALTIIVWTLVVWLLITLAAPVVFFGLLFWGWLRKKRPFSTWRLRRQQREYREARERIQANRKRAADLVGRR